MVLGRALTSQASGAVSAAVAIVVVPEAATNDVWRGRIFAHRAKHQDRAAQAAADYKSLLDVRTPGQCLRLWTTQHC